MAEVNSPLSGIALEVHFGEFNDIESIRSSMNKLFNVHIPSKNKAFEKNAKIIYTLCSHTFRNFVYSGGHNWKNRTFNLADAYVCFMVYNGKKSDEWLWIPPKRATKLHPANGYPAYKKDNYFFKVLSKSEAKGNIKNYFRRFQEDGETYFIDRVKSKNIRTGRLIYKRDDMVNGNAAANALYRTYKVLKEDGVTVVFANAVFYSVYLERQLVRKKVITAFKSMANYLISKYGDRLTGAGLIVRKTNPIYHPKGNKIKLRGYMNI